jgi:hypothetical protein
MDVGHVVRLLDRVEAELVGGTVVSHAHPGPAKKTEKPCG